MTNSDKTSKVIKLNHYNYESWRDEIRPVLRSVDAYNIALGNELFPVGGGNAVTVRTQQRDFEKRSGKGAHAILSSCTSEIKTIIKHLDNPHEMWETLRTRLNNQESQAARTRIRDRFDSARIGKEEKVGEYFTRLCDYHQQLPNTIDAINDQAFRGHIYKTLKSAPKHHTIITILQMQQPPPSREEVMRTIRTNEEETKVSELVDVSDAAAGLYASHSSGRGNRGGRRGSGRGRGGRSPYGAGRNTDSGRSYRCTHCRMDNHTTTECGKLNRPARSSNNATKIDDSERTCYHCGLSGHFKADCIHRKRAQEQRNKVRKSGSATAAIATADGDRDML